jgi:hypothetical protein
MKAATYLCGSIITLRTVVRSQKLVARSQESEFNPNEIATHLSGARNDRKGRARNDKQKWPVSASPSRWVIIYRTRILPACISPSAAA